MRRGPEGSKATKGPGEMRRGPGPHGKKRPLTNCGKVLGHPPMKEHPS